MSLVFECKYCPATFHQFRLLVSHYESKHNPGSEPYRKLRHSTFYSSSDSGCWQATEHLGYQSSCLNCPFPKCKLDEPGFGPGRAKKRSRNEEIIQRFKKGEEVADLAIAYGVSRRTVQRVVKKSRGENG